jgi:Ser/Thr protein kinase RdoA (MazF antagonist)
VGREEGPPVVAKFYRPARWSDAAILEEHAFTRELAELEIPVVPPLLLAGKRRHLHDASGLPLRRLSAPGRTHAGIRPPDTLEWMGRFIGRIHAIGALKPMFEHRPTLDIASFGEEAARLPAGGHWLPDDLLPAWRSVIDQALDAVRGTASSGPAISSILRLHGDCHAGNVLWTDGGPHFVDFDDSRMGPAVQDLWMLLSGERAAMVRQLADVLAGYEDFLRVRPRELHLVEALRTLRLIHHAAWLARRWDDPAFPAAFPWFNTQHYWQDRILELREQIALMQEEPLWPV